jgi:hypothetical protein
MNSTDTRDTDTFRNHPDFGPATETIVRSWPAADLVRRTGAFMRPVVLKDSELVGMIKHTRNGDAFIEEFRMGSVVSYALRYGVCPIAAVERAKGFGHDLHWISGTATVLSNSPQARRRVIEVAIGQTITFEGRLFEITKQPNSNLGLKFIAMA